MIPDLKSTGRRRRALGITQRALAQRVGCSQSNLAKIEAGKIVPSYSLACKIFLELDIQERRHDRTVKDVMHSPVISFDVSQIVADAARAAKKQGLDQFPVLRRGHVVGSVTSVSLIGVRNTVPLQAIMSPALPTVPPSAPVSAVGGLLKVAGAVLVLEDGEIRGIVSAHDLL